MGKAARKPDDAGEAFELAPAVPTANEAARAALAERIAQYDASQAAVDGNRAALAQARKMIDGARQAVADQTEALAEAKVAFNRQIAAEARGEIAASTVSLFDVRRSLEEAQDRLGAAEEAEATLQAEAEQFQAANTARKYWLQSEIAAVVRTSPEIQGLLPAYKEAAATLNRLGQLMDKLAFDNMLPDEPAWKNYNWPDPATTFADLSPWTNIITALETDATAVMPTETAPPIGGPGF